MGHQQSAITSMTFLFSLMPIFLFATTKSQAHLDYKKMAEFETMAYKAYYKNDKGQFLNHYSHLLQLKYGIKDQEVAKRIANEYTVAAMAFAKTPSSSIGATYKQNVLPLLSRMYRSLKEELNAKWDYRNVAAADLSWWVTRRNVSTENPEIVASKMLIQWQLMYGKLAQSEFRRAAYLRAVAGRYGDLCRKRWDGYSDSDWKTTELMLSEAYRYLSLGIVRNGVAKK